MTQKSISILVPRLLDKDNCNAQNLNARAMLARFSATNLNWTATCYKDPVSEVLANPRVKVVRLWKRRLWLLRMWLFYLQSADAMFYPGMEVVDEVGLRWRKRLYPDLPVIALLEGLAGNEQRSSKLAQWAGHPVPCHTVSDMQLARVDNILSQVDHIIAISPFLAAMGRHLYGDKFSTLPFGIDTSCYYPPESRSAKRKLVVSAGRVAKHKRPELMLTLAALHPESDFIWYGTGPLQKGICDKIVSGRLKNVSFPGALTPVQLGDALREADLFVMPSLSEGVPKVTQEAAACGLPVVLFGFYEAPSVVDGENGCVVWSDDEFFAKVAGLLVNHGELTRLGSNGAKLAAQWNWDLVAPQWETAICNIVSRYHANKRSKIDD